MSTVAEANAIKFNEMSTEWDKNPHKAKFSSSVANGITEVFKTHLPEKNNLHIMDFGAGTGTLSLLFLKEFEDKIERIDTVDVSQGMANAIKEKKEKLAEEGFSKITDKLNINILNIFTEPEKLEKNRYDAIVSGMTFHHLENVPKALSLLNDYLVPGGILIFTDLDKEAEHADTFHCKHMTHEVCYKGGFSESELRQWLHEAGFEKEEFHRNVTIQKKGNDDTMRDFTLMTTCAFKK
ncbi:hypothetical protein ABK040_014977 [Willaertia magna]